MGYYAAEMNNPKIFMAWNKSLYLAYAIVYDILLGPQANRAAAFSDLLKGCASTNW